MFRIQAYRDSRIREWLLGAFCLIFAQCFCVFSARAEPWRNDKLCGNKLIVEEGDEDGCEQSFCSDLSAQRKICACLKPKSDTVILSLNQQNGSAITWATEVSPVYLDENSFRIDSVDLLGNGENQFLIAIRNSESMGIGIEYWTVWAFDGTNVKSPLHVDDYGSLSYPTQSESSQTCQLFATRWLDGWEPGRGNGLYMAGNWYAYQKDGTFLKNWNRPALYRRYLPSLEKERLHSIEAGRSLLWFKSPKTKPIVGPSPFERYSGWPITKHKSP